MLQSCGLDHKPACVTLRRVCCCRSSPFWEMRPCVENASKYEVYLQDLIMRDACKQWKMSENESTLQKGCTLCSCRLSFAGHCCQGQCWWGGMWVILLDRKCDNVYHTAPGVRRTPRGGPWSISWHARFISCREPNTMLWTVFKRTSRCHRTVRAGEKDVFLMKEKRWEKTNKAR